MSKFIIVSSPSGGGKTTLVHFLLKQDFNLAFSVSACSRTKRPNETDGKDYWFITAEEFRKKIAARELLEWQEVYPGQYYGTLKPEVDRMVNEGKNVIFDVDAVGGLNLKKHFGKESLSIFISPPSLGVLKKRLEGRKTESPESIAKRVAKAGQEMGMAERFDLVVINDTLDRMCKEVKEKVKGFLQG